MTLTVSQVWGVIALFYIVLFGIAAFHMAKLMERLRELQCTDAQVKYFGTVASVFCWAVPFMTAFVCCVMMVYVDFQAIAK
jgi:hypothetical protein